MVDKNACVSQQWWGNTIISGLYLKKERLALNFKYFMNIWQPFQSSNKSLKHCAIISNVQWLPSLTIYISSMLDETESKTVHKDKEGDWLRKKK